MSWAERLDRWLYRKLYAEPEDFRALVAELEEQTRRHKAAIATLRQFDCHKRRISIREVIL